MIRSTSAVKPTSVPRLETVRLIRNFGDFYSFRFFYILQIP